MLEIDVTALKEVRASPERIERFRAAVERAYERAEAEQPQLSSAPHSHRLHVVWLGLPEGAEGDTTVVATFIGSDASLSATTPEHLEESLYQRFLEIAELL